jgi:hypothetical protein
MRHSPRVATWIVIGFIVVACGSAESPAPSATAPAPGPAASSATATPGATPAPPASPLPTPVLGEALRPVRGSARELGERVGMAPGADGTLFVSIPRSGGSILALLDGGGRSRPGWPITINNSTSCGAPMAVVDGSVRIICDGTDLPKYDNDPSDVRAFAFDAAGRSMPGWPVSLRPGFGRVIGDDLVYFAEQWITDTYDVGMVSHEAWVTTVTADGSVRAGKKVPVIESDSGERWALGPDGVAYGWLHDYGGIPEAPKSSTLVAVGMAGKVKGITTKLDGLASPPAFDEAGRLHVTVNAGRDRTARTFVLDTNGRAVEGGSRDLGFVATDACDGIEGMCEVPIAPPVAEDGTTFVVGAHYAGTTAASVSASGEMIAGWPYESDDGSQGTGICAPGDICEGGNLAIPALGPNNDLYLIHRAADASIGGRIVAVGSDGRVRPGWPVELKRPGAEFWSVVVGSDGTVYALAIEPEAGDGSSASILGIAPDSTVRSITTIIEP